MTYKIVPREFWTDPEAHYGLLPDRYIDTCLPEEYFEHKEFSLRLLEAIDLYADKHSSILEIGCSVGRNIYYLQDAGYANITGIEINPTSARFASTGFESYASTKQIEIINSSIEDYYRASHAQFDVIFTQSVLMHLPPSSEWVFQSMAQQASKLIVTHEVEDTGGDGAEIKWSRNYKDIFGALGFKQIGATNYSPQVLRVLARRAESE